MEELNLISETNDVVILKLNKVRKPYVVEEFLGIHSKVYNDMAYRVKLDSTKDIRCISVYLNGELLDTDLRDDVIYFCGDNRNMFSGVIGFAQITLCILYDNSDCEWLYSEYASVLIKETETNKTLDLMLKYVYENQEDILRRNVKLTGMGKNLDKTYDDFWSQIVLFEDIAHIYESSFGYFKANCRYKLEDIDVLERVEKLKKVDSKTMQYIIHHPEFLKNSVTGIKSGRQYFLPSKTLMTQKHITNDIYENQVIVSFLEQIMEEVHSLAGKIKLYIEMIRNDGKTENGYIVSTYLLYVNAEKVLNEFIQKALELENQYSKLVILYTGIFNVKHVVMAKKPEPTAIFMSLPQYNRIYLCILKWFDKVGYDLYNERVMFNFINAPLIYEAYVLIKIINYIKDLGFELIETKTTVYPKQSSWLYRNQNYNNTYVFLHEETKISLYYEPVIYDEIRKNSNEMTLYRNNSVSLSRETDDERKGHYYVPDFVIKFEKDRKTSYIICDAKFSRKDKVKYKLMPDLIFKYITSISTIDKEAEIKGLFVFYGINEENKGIESFYDCKIKNGKIIEPRIEMLPMSEGISNSEQDSNLTEMIKSIMDNRK